MSSLEDGGNRPSPGELALLIGARHGFVPEGAGVYDAEGRRQWVPLWLWSALEGRNLIRPESDRAGWVLTAEGRTLVHRYGGLHLQDDDVLRMQSLAT